MSVHIYDNVFVRIISAMCFSPPFCFCLMSVLRYCSKPLTHGNVLRVMDVGQYPSALGMKRRFPTPGRERSHWEPSHRG